MVTPREMRQFAADCLRWSDQIDNAGHRDLNDPDREELDQHGSSRRTSLGSWRPTGGARPSEQARLRTLRRFSPPGSLARSLSLSPPVPLTIRPLPRAIWMPRALRPAAITRNHSAPPSPRSPGDVAALASKLLASSLVGSCIRRCPDRMTR